MGKIDRNIGRNDLLSMEFCSLLNVLYREALCRLRDEIATYIAICRINRIRKILPNLRDPFLKRKLSSFNSSLCKSTN